MIQENEGGYLTEAEYVKKLMLDTGLTKDATLGEFFAALDADELKTDEMKNEVIP